MAYNQPVKVGDTIKQTIINIGQKGDGIAKYKDFIIIIPNTEIDKEYKIKIVKVFDKFAIGEKEE